MSMAMFGIPRQRLSSPESHANQNLADAFRAMAFMMATPKYGADYVTNDYLRRDGVLDSLRNMVKETLPALEREAPDVAEKVRNFEINLQGLAG